VAGTRSDRHRRVRHPVLDDAAIVSQYTDDRASLDDVAALVARDFATAFTRSRRVVVTELRLLAGRWPFSLAAVDRPVHLRHGARDANVPMAGARALRDRPPDAPWSAFESADHLIRIMVTVYRWFAGTVGEPPVTT
jgi:pimeloyl-ACP methyl ester carboxylesterase